jgi:flagellar assembly factor FliW
MKVQTAHFGEVEIDKAKILVFENGLPDWRIIKGMSCSPARRAVRQLASIGGGIHISLPVMDPFKICPDYSFDIAQDDINALGVKDVRDVFVLSVLVIPRNASIMTINLTAPIIINVGNNRGCQIILDDRKYRVRVPVSELLGKPAKDGV